MNFEDLPIEGAVVIAPEAVDDERGAFARVFDAEEFRARGLDTRVAQCSISTNRRRGTLRGLHYQAAPHGECKLIRCEQGSIFDVLVDLRPDSATYRHWAGVELAAADHRLVYAPEGVAHGFVTLADDSAVYYQISVPYEPSSARGVRWDDPRFGIEWPEPVRVISDRDAGFPDFEG